MCKESNENIICNSADDSQLYIRLFIRNRGLIIIFCKAFYKEYSKQLKKKGVQYQELIQESYFAIPEAVSAFRSGGKKFTTHLNESVFKHLSTVYGNINKSESIQNGI